MNILYVANLIPYPLDSGGKIFTFSTIKSLSEGNSIDLVCFYEHEDIIAGKEKLKDYCNSVEVLPVRVTTRENMSFMMRKAVNSLISPIPLAVSKYITTEMKSLLKKKLSTKKYDCVFFNLLAMYGYCDYIKELDPTIKTVLYEQNCEALIYKRYLRNRNNIVKKFFLEIESKKLEKFEQKAIKAVDRLIVLSEEDRQGLGISSERCSIIPIGVSQGGYAKVYNQESKTKLRMLFVGTMTWAPNNEGIIWFLENVMPLCNDDKKYELNIVGKNPSEKVKNLCSNYKNVNLIGYVESLDQVYNECDVLVVPLFIGSGQRVKIIEAFSKSYAVISTSIGAEGLKYVDGKTLLIANNASEFKKQIDRCFSGVLLKELGEGGKTIFDNEYSVDVISKKINEALL